MSGWRIRGLTERFGGWGWLQLVRIAYGETRSIADFHNDGRFEEVLHGMRLLMLSLLGVGIMVEARVG